MNATYTNGTAVYVIGLRGENGDKTHCANGVVEAEGVAMYAAYACDGNGMQAGNGGYLRGTGSIICAKNDAELDAKLDAAITCELCRANMGLAPVAKSEAALQTIAAKKAAVKDAATAKKTAAKIAELEKTLAYVRRTMAAATLYNATPDAELIAASVKKFNDAYGPYPAETIARMMEDPREAEAVAEKKATNARTIQKDPATIKNLEKRIAELKG